MSDPQKKLRQFHMSYQAVAASLIKANNIHEGTFRVGLEFGAPTGVNANFMGKQLPAVFVPVMGIVLIEDDGTNELSVDAAVVNPRQVLVSH